MNKQQDPTVQHIYIGNYIQYPILNQNLKNEKELYIYTYKASQMVQW